MRVALVLSGRRANSLPGRSLWRRLVPVDRDSALVPQWDNRLRTRGRHPYPSAHRKKRSPLLLPWAGSAYITNSARRITSK